MKEKIKVLHYAKYYPPYSGGIEKVTYDIVEELCDNEDMTIEVLCYKKNKDEDKCDYKLRYKVKRSKTLAIIYKMPISLNIFFSLLIRRVKCHVIHVHLPNPLAMLYILITNLFSNNKIVVHWHSDIVNQKKLSKIVYYLEMIFLQHVDKIIVTSKEYAESSLVLKKFTDKVRVIPIGINTCDLVPNEEVVKKIKARYSGKNIIFSLGRLTYYKGFEYLIKAAKFLDDNYIILIGGGGEEKATLEKLIKDNNLNEKVKLLGRIDDEEIAAYYKSARLFCLPSIVRSEAFGVVQLEAMSLGTPVISTNIVGSGVPWVNKNNQSGLTVSPKSEIELARAIKLICNDDDLHNKLSNGAKKRFEKYFTSSAMNKKIINLYKEL